MRRFLLLLPVALLLRCQVANRRVGGVGETGVGGGGHILNQTGMDLKYAKNAPDRRPLPPLSPRAEVQPTFYLPPSRPPPTSPTHSIPPLHTHTHSEHTDGPARAQDINNASFHSVDPDVFKGRRFGLLFFFFINFQKYFWATRGRVEEGGGGVERGREPDAR